MESLLKKKDFPIFTGFDLWPILSCVGSSDNTSRRVDQDQTVDLITALRGKRKAGEMERLPNGTRVQLHPATDAWMQGDRYGEIVGLGNRREYVDRSTGEHTFMRPYRVKLDKSGRIVRLHPDWVYPID